ncbi:MAG: TetR/AcrR family transcriptional regulator [Solirubrobacteraceae bacterium]
MRVARTVLASEGPGALTMRRVAQELGIQAPSIYKHLADKQALENALISAAFEEQAALFETALGEPDPIAALAAAYRAYARDNPHLYRLMTDRALDRQHLWPGAEARAAAPLISALGGDTDLARALFAFAHGMAILELNDRFAPGADLDAAWRRGLDALRA